MGYKRGGFGGKVVFFQKLQDILYIAKIPIRSALRSLFQREGIGKRKSE